MRQVPITGTAGLGSGANKVGRNPLASTVMFSTGINVSPPESMDFRDTNFWGTCITRFERYMCVAKIATRPEEE